MEVVRPKIKRDVKDYTLDIIIHNIPIIIFIYVYLIYYQLFNLTL